MMGMGTDRPDVVQTGAAIIREGGRADGRVDGRVDRGTWVREGGAQSLFSMLPVAVAVAASAFDKARAPAALTWINIFDH
eukprot:1389858-Rhodomonas_salina.1